MNSYMENYILDINPIAFSVGPINVYWYGLAYMAGMVLGLFYALKIVDAKKENCNLLITKCILHKLLGQSIQTFMRNLDPVAQRMVQLLHNYVTS